MTRIAVTGHMNLSPETAASVAGAITAALADRDPAALIGLSCLARGADSIFAEAVLASCDRLFAVWDGEKPVDRGGTGSVVRSARARGIAVDVFWPEGAARV